MVKKPFLLIVAGLCLYPIFPRGSQEVSGALRETGKAASRSSSKPRTPLEAYYAGRVEEAARDFGRARTAEKTQLVVIHWELGEMDKAAALLEELLQDKDLSPGERGELQVELFYTYCLLSDYARAIPLRSAAEGALQNMDSRGRAEFHFYAAMSWEAAGNAGKAMELYKLSLDGDKWRPMGWYRLGLLQRADKPKEAEKSLQTCWEQDSAFTEALLPLARLLMARGEWRKARDYLITANTRLPADKEIAAALGEARKHAPGGGAAGEGLGLIRREIRAAPPKVQPAPSFPKEGIIRVGLAEKRSLVSVKAGGAFKVRAAGDSRVLYQGAAGEQFWVEWIRGSGGGSLLIQGRDKKTLAQGSAPLVYEIGDAGNTSIVAGVVNGAPGTNRTYRGNLEFQPRPEGMTVVNIVPLEDYLYGVVPSEMPASWPAESLKAQTIAARSYAIANKGQFADRGFDLYGTPHSQAYHGVGAEDKRAGSAVDLTRGIILLGGKEPLKAYYSANHGGYSEDSLTLWGYDAYMQAVPDKLISPRTGPQPLDALYRWIRNAPHSYSSVPRYFYASAYRWEKWVRPGEIRRRITASLREDPGEISQIISRGRGVSGRIVELEVRGSKGSVRVKGDPIWNAMGSLRSSLFTIRCQRSPEGGLEYFVFQGAGYGHGIGLDQHGAAGMASAGFNVEEILRHYYPRAAIGRL